MLARSNKLIHPSGVSIETPLLVPSFSSKGFTFSKDEISEANDVLKVSSEFLTESMLLSAYDLYHKHFSFSDQYLSTEIIFIDSGGYETGDIYDLSSNAKYSYPVKEWSIDKYQEIVEKWPQNKAAILVSYDSAKERHPMETQINNANIFFSKHKSFLHDLLLKPETEDQRYVHIDNIVKLASSFADVPVIGITEKELGNSILHRMLNISKIRLALDKKNIVAPIHIFGSLDPISTFLYFFAGAEIFDGLTWLKYSYFGGAAIYQSNFGVLDSDIGIHVRDVQVRIKAIVNNIYVLERMKYLMKDFLVTNDFTLFNKISPGLGAKLEDCHKTFKSNIS